MSGIALHLNRYRLVLNRLAPAAVFVLFCTSGSAADVTQYYLPAAFPVTLRFSALDPARAPIDQQWLLSELTAALQSQSGRQLESAGEATVELTGLRNRLDQEGSQIVFEYVHVARNRIGDEWGQTLTIPVSYRIERSKDVITVRLSPPQMAKFATRTTPGIFFLPTPKLGHIKQLLDDFAAIMRNAAFLRLHRSVLLGGAEEAGVSPQVCIASFERLLGRYGYVKGEERVFDPQRDDVFLYRTAQNNVPLKIAAVPYRGGSKVFFEAWVPFELRADGTVAGYELPQALETDVRRILEDQASRELESGLDGIRNRS
jgi:hypothetical protein